jgi:hypothetical protein
MLENSIEINDLASSQKLQQYQALKNSKEIKHLGTLVFLKVDHQYRTLGSKCQAIFQVFLYPFVSTGIGGTSSVLDFGFSVPALSFFKYIIAPLFGNVKLYLNVFSD